MKNKISLGEIVAVARDTRIWLHSWKLIFWMGGCFGIKNAIKMLEDKGWNFFLEMKLNPLYQGNELLMKIYILNVRYKIEVGIYFRV